MKKAKRIALVLFTILLVLSLTGIVAARKRSRHPPRKPKRPPYRRHYPHRYPPSCFIASVAGDFSRVAISTEFKEWLVGH